MKDAQRRTCLAAVAITFHEQFRWYKFWIPVNVWNFQKQSNLLKVVFDLAYNLFPLKTDGHFNEKRRIMINYVGQECKGLKDESFKEHTLIHLFWADPGQGTFQFLKETYCGKLFSLHQYCLWLSFGKTQFVCRGSHNILFSLSRFECFVSSWLNFLFLFLMYLSQSICSTTNPLHKELTEHASSPTKRRKNLK